MELLANLNGLINTANTFLWGYILIIALIAAGVYFTVTSGFAQFTLLKHAFTLVAKKEQKTGKNKHHISSFQALSTSMASVVGIGSIAGIALAISLGGPGAIFWVWAISLIGMSTSIIEHTLGQLYKKKANNGDHFVGGPAYYILHGLKNKPIAILFSLIIVIVFGLVFNSVQANTIGSSLEHAFNVNKNITATVLVIFAGLIIFGGIKRIAKVSSVLVPTMGLVYLGIALVVIIFNIKEIPAIAVTIVKSAFGIQEAVAGTVSYMFMQTILIGIKRALFATEAGMGSTPNITASAFVKHPVRQGLVGMLGVCFVSFIVCTATAILVLSSNLYYSNVELTGIALVQASLSETLGNFAVYVLSFSVFVFGFTSIIGNYSYAEHNLAFINKNKVLPYVLRILLLITVYLGTLASLATVWNLADMFMGLMILINLWAAFMLRKIALSAIKDYKEQLKTKSEPIFKKSTIKALENDNENVW